MTEFESECDRAIDYAMSEFARVGDLSKMPTPLRTVLLVHAAQGIIDNGGLQYFFESDWPDQPPYSVFIEAYRNIGADGEAAALAAAVALFPFPDPHKHQSRRDKFLEQFQMGGMHRPDSPFEPYTDQICGSEDVWQLLAAYVSANSTAFVSPGGAP